MSDVRCLRKPRFYMTLVCWNKTKSCYVPVDRADQLGLMEKIISPKFHCTLNLFKWLRNQAGCSAWKVACFSTSHRWHNHDLSSWSESKGATPPQENKGFFKGMMVVDKPLIRHNKAIRPWFLGVVTWVRGTWLSQSRPWRPSSLAKRFPSAFRMMPPTPRRAYVTLCLLWQERIIKVATFDV